MTAQELAETSWHAQSGDTMPVPAVSIVIPAFDVWPWVTECLRSILREDRVSLEVIVVDDGSTDNTAEIVAETARKDERIRLIRTEGVGGGQARNIGARAARGDYLMFCDADDVVAPGGIIRMHQAAVLTRADMVIGNFLKFAASQTWSPTERWNLFVERRENVTLRDVPGLIRNRACWNRLFAKSFWERQAIRFPTVPRSNDIVPMTLALTLARRITVIPEVVYLYRQRPGSGSMTARAGSVASSLSYLGQEEICRALVASVADEAVNAAYWGMLLDSDLWMQSNRYLQYIDGGGPISPEIESAIRSIVTDRRDRSWARVLPDRQAIYSLIGAGCSRQAAELRRDFGARRGEITEDFIYRQVETIDHVIRLGDATHDAVSDLYSQLVLLPIDRFGSQAGAGRIITRVHERARDWGVTVRLREPTNSLLRLHAVLTGQEVTPARQLAAERSIETPAVEAIEDGGGKVRITLAPPRHGMVTAAELRSVAGRTAIRVAATDGGRLVMKFTSAEVRSPGTWHAWIRLSCDGVDTWRELRLDDPNLVPASTGLSQFVVRPPGERRRLIIYRRPSIVSRFAARLQRAVAPGTRQR